MERAQVSISPISHGTVGCVATVEKDGIRWEPGDIVPNNLTGFSFLYDAMSKDG